MRILDYICLFYLFIVFMAGAVVLANRMEKQENTNKDNEVTETVQQIQRLKLLRVI